MIPKKNYMYSSSVCLEFTLSGTISLQVGMKQGWQCDFEEKALCGSLNEGVSDNSDWEWVNGDEGGKLILYFSGLCSI